MVQLRIRYKIQNPERYHAAWSRQLIEDQSGRLSWGAFVSSPFSGLLTKALALGIMVALALQVILAPRSNRTSRTPSEPEAKEAYNTQPEPALPRFVPDHPEFR